LSYYLLDIKIIKEGHLHSFYATVVVMAVDDSWCNGCRLQTLDALTSHPKATVNNAAKSSPWLDVTIPVEVIV
jgi:hypothetical protein